MSLAIPLETLARGFKPLDVASYLRLHGWRQQDVERERFSIWTKGDETRGDFEVMLPMQPAFSDFGRRIKELVETLEAFERRPNIEIIEDLSTPNADIVRARLAPDGDFDGTLPLEDGAHAFQEMRELMLAAACAAVVPKQVFTKRKPDRAMKYLREARIGQTRRGSYVITVLSPVPPLFMAANKEGLLLQEVEEEPFARKTVRTLADALTATTEGVQVAAASGNLDALTSGVARGVSANLCEAVFGLHEGSGERGIEFAFSWAPSRGVPPDIKSVQRLQPDSMLYLQEASRYFRQTSELEEVEVSGVVHRLERVQGDSGDATLVGTADGERRTVVTRLDGGNHHLAIKAYEERLPVRCVGELVKEGKSYRLKNPRDFGLLGESQ